MNFEIIGQRIRERRKILHLTQKQLAEKIGKTESSMQKYEAGKVEIPFSVLENIADVLNVEILELMDNHTQFSIDNNLDIERDDYLVALGYQCGCFSDECFEIKYNGYSYRIPTKDYLDLLMDIDYNTHYTIDRLLKKNIDDRQICDDYKPIIKHPLGFKLI